MLLTVRNWSPVLSIRKVRVLVGAAAVLLTRTLPKSTAGGESGVTLIVRVACATPLLPIHTTNSNKPSQRLDILIDVSCTERGGDYRRRARRVPHFEAGPVQLGRRCGNAPLRTISLYRWQP